MGEILNKLLFSWIALLSRLIFSIVGEPENKGGGFDSLYMLLGVVQEESNKTVNSSGNRWVKVVISLIFALY